MKTLTIRPVQYPIKTSIYKYAIVAQDKNKVVAIIEQTESSGTSVTNAIEQIVEEIIKNEGITTSIDNWTIYEHYPEEINSDWLYNYKKVIFEGGSPSWHNVTDEEIKLICSYK